MTERELRNKIQQVLLQYMLAIHAEKIGNHDEVFLTDKIFALITEDGYKSPGEVAETIKEAAYALSDKHKREVAEARIGYVKLKDIQRILEEAGDLRSLERELVTYIAGMKEEKDGQRN